jgi:DNA-binding response OmpR family regulator
MSVKVVYIDDEPDMCTMFSDNFSSERIHVHTFSNSVEGLNFIKNSPPDLVILDYSMPGENGEQVAEKINRSVPIALISGELELVLKGKYARQFTKPFDFLEMEHFILSFEKR